MAEPSIVFNTFPGYRNDSLAAAILNLLTNARHHIQYYLSPWVTFYSRGPCAFTIFGNLVTKSWGLPLHCELELGVVAPPYGVPAISFPLLPQSHKCRIITPSKKERLLPITPSPTMPLPLLSRPAPTAS